MTAPLSVCIIHREDPHLEATVASIRPHVAEICILNTPTAVGDSERVRALADRYDELDGELWDFSEARNRCQALATHDASMWLDSDDIFVGGERLAAFLTSMPEGNAQIELPYHQGHDDKDRVTCLQWRERIVRPTKAFRWEGRAHEVLKCTQGAPARSRTQTMRVLHKGGNGEASKERCLRLLRRWTEEESGNEQAWFYLGWALFDAKQDEPAIHMLSGLMLERLPEAMAHAACLLLVDLELRDKGGPRPSAALRWAHKAFRFLPCAESLFAIGQAHIDAAKLESDQSTHWSRAAQAIRFGLSLPPSPDALWTNPLDRDFWAHDSLAVCLAKMSELEEAFAHAMKAVEAWPDKPETLSNALLIEAELARRGTLEAAKAVDSVRDRLERMQSTGVLREDVVEAIRSIVGGGA